MKTTNLSIRTEDGTCSATLVTPKVTPAAGVLLYMDAFGLRPAVVAIAERLASEGYVVLVPDLFYRDAPNNVEDAKAPFDDAMRSRIGPRGAKLAGDAFKRDSEAYLATLEGRPEVTQVIGATGYCMGGRFALQTAAYHPDRLRVVLSFHGGGLVSDKADAPVSLASQIKARVYIGSPQADSSFTAEDEGKLATAFRHGGVDHLIETYAGAKHGFTMSDSSVYDAKAAAKHDRRLLELLRESQG